jgi:hypothetical protein
MILQLEEEELRGAAEQGQHPGHPYHHLSEDNVTFKHVVVLRGWNRIIIGAPELP